jgi:hypothetical protein
MATRAVQDSTGRVRTGRIGGPAGTPGALVGNVFSGLGLGVAALTVTLNLTGAIVGVGSLSGALTNVPSADLVGSVPGAGSLAGALTNVSNYALTGSVSGVGDVEGSLTNIPGAFLVGNVPGVGALAGTLTITSAVASYVFGPNVQTVTKAGKVYADMIGALTK